MCWLYIYINIHIYTFCSVFLLSLAGSKCIFFFFLVPHSWSNIGFLYRSCKREDCPLVSPPPRSLSCTRGLPCLMALSAKYSKGSEYPSVMRTWSTWIALKAACLRQSRREECTVMKGFWQFYELSAYFVPRLSVFKINVTSILLYGQQRQQCNLTSNIWIVVLWWESSLQDNVVFFFFFPLIISPSLFQFFFFFF